jgi:hypothetical protein
MESTLTTPDDNERDGYILINSGITRFDVPPFPDTGTGEVLILSTNPSDWGAPVVSRIDVGGRPVHSYGVYTHDQVRKRSNTTHSVIDEPVQMPPDLNTILCLESCLFYSFGLTPMPMDTST